MPVTARSLAPPTEPGDPVAVDDRQLLAGLRALRRGDFAFRLPADRVGLAGEIAEAFNDAAEIHQRMSKEFDRISVVVGRDGRIAQRASLGDVPGSWARYVDCVNGLISDLTEPTTEVNRVLSAVAKGDLAQRITLAIDGRPLKGEFLRSSRNVNAMVDQLNSFAAEVTRVAREVGTEGKLGGQADARRVEGTWRDLTDSVNSMAGNLTNQVRNIADVTTAVANGDLSRKITADARGEILELKNTINIMVDQLNSFASEVTRVAREVGTEGKLGGQADVVGVAGTWRDLTDSVNFMAGNLTSQVRNIADVTTAVANGDLSRKITAEARGEVLELKTTVNLMVDQLNSFASEVTRVAREVGTEGKLGGQADVRGVAGTWRDLTDSVNFMAGNLTSQVRNIADVTTAVANGDLSRKITAEARGEVLELKTTVNTMVDQLNSFASEVTRVAREVGTEGTLGGQARVEGVAGTWRDLTDNVNQLAGNLTEQVRGIARVVTAVANGNLKRKLNLVARGEVAALGETINDMIDTLAIFADQVSTVAREVGFEGKLGGQARVPGASGTWRGLTDNVNQLAASLTTQLRAIGEVATAVTKGDLSRSIQVDAQGEVKLLKDNINEMIGNLRDTTLQNTEQDWLKSNLARFTVMLQGQTDLQTVGRMILSELAPLVSVQHGVFCLNEPSDGQPVLNLLATYAYRPRPALSTHFKLGEGLIGQAAYERHRILVTNVPADYVEINSGLGSAPPLSIVALPVLFEGDVKAVIELASFDSFSEIHLSFLDQVTESIGVVLNTLAANIRTENLLKQSQALTSELQQRQEELQQTNAALEEKASLLSDQNQEVERRRLEIDEARLALEQKAEQLALTSKYKSQFLANMSHELRTPLNSLLILSQQLADNRDENLTALQVEFAQAIRAAGNDLLMLINDILDLSKIESGKTAIQVGPASLRDQVDDLERTFRQLAQQKSLNFTVELDPKLPAYITTDQTRLQQVLKNLLSNAFKFTEYGSVKLTITPVLDRAGGAIAFAVSDTGLGIPRDKHALIFEAFQQADMDTSRRFGGTGLGLSISREIAGLLGGEIQLESSPGQGSTFTLLLPLTLKAPEIDSTSSLAVTELVPAGAAAAHQSVPVLGVRSDAAVLLAANEMADDRDAIGTDDRVMLIVEDDMAFARTLLGMARERNFKVLVALDGDAGVSLARKFKPRAITLDMYLPKLDGWKVLDALKHDPNTRHIPVYVITAADQRQRALSSGAIGHVMKPVSPEALSGAFNTLIGFVDREKKSLLLVEDDDARRTTITELIGNTDVLTTTVRSGTDALAVALESQIDCVVVDLELPDMNAFELIEQLNAVPDRLPIPAIIYTVRGFSRAEQTWLRKLAGTTTLKGVTSLAGLLDETTVFLHRVEANLSAAKRKMIRDVHRSDPLLDGKRVLIVDDDRRNIFALTSALERYKMVTSHAVNGRGAIEVLQKHPDIDVVLMDIMMPEMDGFETIRTVRLDPQFAALPIIALTAKAMPGDREKCIAAGASDYITKPVDLEQLVSLLRVWLYR